MGRRLDYTAHHFRKRPGPIVSDGMGDAFQKEARWLAARIKAGKPSANAKKSGPVRILTADERRVIEGRMRAEGRL